MLLIQCCSYKEVTDVIRGIPYVTKIKVSSKKRKPFYYVFIHSENDKTVCYVSRTDRKKGTKIPNVKHKRIDYANFRNGSQQSSL